MPGLPGRCTWPTCYIGLGVQKTGLWGQNLQMLAVWTGRVCCKLNSSFYTQCRAQVHLGLSEFGGAQPSVLQVVLKRTRCVWHARHGPTKASSASC